MIPIVFVHTGREFEHQQIVVDQAFRWNPASSVTWIGDAQLGDYRKGVDAFHAAYVNLSSNPSWFEEHAFWRWLILAEWCEKNNVEVVFHLDSDVLLCADVNVDYDLIWKQWPISLVLGECGACCFFTREHLQAFAEFLVKTYVDKGEDFNALVDLYASMQKQGLDGGACDMYLLKLWRTRHSIPYGEMTDIIDAASYDHIMRSPNPGGFQIENGVKAIQLVSGTLGRPNVPCAFNDGGAVRMKSLHFQGDTEQLIPEYWRKANE